MVHSGDRTELYHYQLAQQRGNQARNQNGRKGNANVETDKQKNRRQVLNTARNNIIRLVIIHHSNVCRKYERLIAKQIRFT